MGQFPGEYLHSLFVLGVEMLNSLERFEEPSVDVFVCLELRLMMRDVLYSGKKIRHNRKDASRLFF